MRPASATPASVGDVPEPPAAEVLPELVAAHLIDEVDVVQAVAVDVSDGDPVAVIVVDRLVMLPGVLDDVMDEGDAARRDGVGELKIVERAKTASGGQLSLLAGRERLDALIRIGRADLGRPADALGVARSRARAGAREKADGAAHDERHADRLAWCMA